MENSNSDKGDMDMKEREKKWVPVLYIGIYYDAYVQFWRHNYFIQGELCLLFCASWTFQRVDC